MASSDKGGGLMPGRINVLDESVINQIAAGEVVEKPASIVKELVENSLDAKATRITVRIIQGGLEGITVIDDGEGIPPDQVALAFDRHATSKLNKADDLFNVTSLGFRGEALPSIASVARVVMETKTHNSNFGTRIIVEGGKRISLSPVGIPDGTSVTVSKLFFNTPARRKFLKNVSSERRGIADLITKISISRPEVSFVFESDGKEILHTDGSGDLRATLALVHGTEVAKELIEVDKPTYYGSVKGLVSLPSHSRGTRGSIYLFVNSRCIESIRLTKAVELGYGSMMAPRRYPIAAIFISIDPSLVDVNVHPAKIQVRFKDDNEIFNAVKDGVKQGLNKVIADDRSLVFSLNPPVYTEDFPVKKKSSGYEIQPEIVWHQPDTEESMVIEETEKNDYEVDTSTGEVLERLPVDKSYVYSARLTIGSKDIAEVRQVLKEAKVSGQVLDTYVLIPTRRGLWLVDQHAAHERILFEKFLTQKDKPTDAQELLIPMTVEISPALASVIPELQPPLKQMGIEIEPFGGRSVLIRTLPVDFQAGDQPIKEMVEELATIWLENRKEEREERIAALLACKGAIKAGKYLSNEILKDILIRLAETKNPLSCPHGRPTLIEISLKELEKRFDRH
jgi:DNA mismatch repair protein MutL